ncbi:MAG: FIST C-terminal domain-containing protein [Spirochaetales bacterium]|jgi:hypothetical protein|nr:FIST C-terminal domain-containing protein [Spirochaetales bacterium]
MIKTLTSWTGEIDDVDAAVAELLGKLELEKKPLLKNSLGIVSCYSEYIESGVLAALAEKLTFPLAGTTTLACAVPGMAGGTHFALTVLSSDDVEFELAASGPIFSAEEAPLRAAYEEAAAKHKGAPACMISFAPLLMNASGDFFVRAFDAITGGVPNFGTLAVDHTSDYHESRTIMGGEAFPDRYVFILLYGEAHPSFFVAGISEEKAFREKGVVTAAEGNQLKTVNNMPVADYLLSLGLLKDDDGHIIGLNSYPFILDYNDGSRPVVRVMFALTPDGSAVCGGEMPLGSTLTVGKIDGGEVLGTTEKVLREALNQKKTGGMLMFSCVGRYFAQGYDSTQEMEKTADILAGRLPWHLSYSGGELCPVSGRDGKLINRSHNDTLVVCLF